MSTEVFSPKRFMAFTVDDWVNSNNRRDAQFTANTDANKGGRIKCSLTCYHNGNYVCGIGYSDVCGDAFVFAVDQIEKTVGVDWRHSK